MDNNFMPNENNQNPAERTSQAEAFGTGGMPVALPQAPPSVPQFVPKRAPKPKKGGANPQYQYGAPSGQEYTPQAAYLYQAPQSADNMVAPYGGQAPVGVNYPHKQRMNTGLKVFLWVISILAAGTLIGFGIFIAHAAVTNYRTEILYQENLPEFEWPFDGENPFGDDDGEEAPYNESPDEEVPPEETVPKVNGMPDATAPLPDIELDPDVKEIISIEKKPAGEELSPTDIYSGSANSIVGIGAVYVDDTTGREVKGAGTGIIATEDGYIVTNSHVVMNSKKTRILITTHDGKEHEAIVVGSDRTTDLAVLKMNGEGYEPAVFGDADELEIGEQVIAIGNPGGQQFSSSLTGGYVSGLDRAVGEYSESGMTYIQTDAAINPGNSGGPLFNMYGQVVGINSSKIITQGYEGMGFAIPVSKAQDIINELSAGGYVKGRTRLGITGIDVSEIEHAYGYPRGFKIMSLADDSAFKGTEAQVGDVITKIEGKAVNGIGELSNQLLTYSPNDKIKLTLFRVNADIPFGEQYGEQLGEEFEVEITLLEDKGETQG